MILKFNKSLSFNFNLNSDSDSVGVFSNKLCFSFTFINSFFKTILSNTLLSLAGFIMPRGTGCNFCSGFKGFTNPICPISVDANIYLRLEFTTSESRGNTICCIVCEFLANCSIIHKKSK